MSDPIEKQLEKWSQTFATRRDFLGPGASEPAQAALTRFVETGVRDLLELGAGQGRDTLLFLGSGIQVTALDYAEPGLEQIRERARDQRLADDLTTIVADVRETLPFRDDAFDACYSHMLLSMALTTDEVARLGAEMRRVVRPGGLVVYTVRNTTDAHFASGKDHGDNRWEMGGFIVHFFDRRLIERLANGFQLLDVSDAEEGRLPRRLSVVTMRKRL